MHDAFLSYPADYYPDGYLRGIRSYFLGGKEQSNLIRKEMPGWFSWFIQKVSVWIIHLVVRCHTPNHSRSTFSKPAFSSVSCSVQKSCVPTAAMACQLLLAVSTARGFAASHSVPGGLPSWCWADVPALRPHVSDVACGTQICLIPLRWIVLQIKVLWPTKVSFL